MYVGMFGDRGSLWPESHGHAWLPNSHFLNAVTGGAGVQLATVLYLLWIWQDMAKEIFMCSVGSYDETSANKQTNIKGVAAAQGC
jgi:hypothetical protein